MYPLAARGTVSVLVARLKTTVVATAGFAMKNWPRQGTREDMGDGRTLWVSRGIFRLDSLDAGRI